VTDDQGLPDLYIDDRHRVTTVDPVRTRELRRTVLRPSLAAGEPLPGDDLPDAVHIAAFATGVATEPLSTCFIFRDACPSLPAARNPWHLRQMATDPGHRGGGAGSAVMAGVFAYLRGVDSGGEASGGAGDVLWCNARVSAAGFYRRMGFHTVGSEFIDSEHPIPHLRMWREV
jgi:GNAT superfamily N-acetyltransferase